MKLITVKRDSYYDSVFLMLATRDLKAAPGVTDAVVTMGTPMNLELLRNLGFAGDQLSKAGPNDLIIAVETESEDAGAEAVALAGDLLTRKKEQAATPGDLPRTGSLSSGLKLIPEANLALISVPGAYAAREAHKALDQGLHVMLFSDNVSLDQEIELKKRAVELGLLMMGPDCGTAIINGMPLCFANQVTRGPVGVVAASGTGLQEVTCLLDRLGTGISQAVGTGGRDLKNPQVGGRTTLLALAALAQDPATRVLVVISKPPAKEVADQVVEAMQASGKPGVALFLGMDEQPRDLPALAFASSLEETALLAEAFVRGASTSAEARNMILTKGPDLGLIRAIAAEEAEKMSGSQRWIRGLFTGGTLADEALFLLERELGGIWSNNQLNPALVPGDSLDRDGHLIIDFGDDEFTRGRPHPMIEPGGRSDRIPALGGAGTTAVLLLDFVLGHGSHPDPVAACLEGIRQAQARLTLHGGHLAVVASVTGTEQDPQSLKAQREQLEQIGARVMPSNYQASLLALEIVRRLEGGSR